VKTDLKIFGNKSYLLLIFICNYNLFGQIPVNGFCKYNSYKSDSGFTSILPLNYNNDSYTDFLLYNNNNSKISLIEGNSAGIISRGVIMDFKSGISNIKNLSFGEIYSQSYVYVSRVSRTAGILNLKNDGRFFLIGEYKFDSYPEKIDVADCDNDQSPEVLVSGPAFNGISLLNIKNGKIFHKQIVGGIPFKDALFIDLDNDGFQDIAGINIFRKTIDFYTNTRRGNFRYTRSVELNSIPSLFHTTDLNLDYYEDIVFTEKKSIVIYPGDGFSSYERRIQINTKYQPHLMVNGDFNNDGNIDIVYADTVTGIVSVIFAEEDFTFSEEYILFQKENITSLVPYYSKFIKGISALTNTGNIYTVTGLFSFSDDVSITSGIKPSGINYFDYKNDGIADICFIDEYDGNINFILRNNAGIPDKIFSKKLHFPQKEIITDFTNKEHVFYLWTSGEKLIEIITADFSIGKIDRNSVYATEKIHDLKIQKVKDGNAAIYAGFIKEGSAGASVFSYHDFRYNKTDFIIEVSDAVDISPFFSDRETGFFIWHKKDKLSLNLSYYNINKPGERQNIGYLPEEEVIAAVRPNSSNNIFFTGSRSGQIVSIIGKKMSRVPLPDSITTASSQWLLYMEKEDQGVGNLYMYLPGKKNLHLITLFNRGKNLILSELISGISIRRYFVKNLSNPGLHLVYTDPDENCITLKRLK
jgi:hypothetical protein